MSHLYTYRTAKACPLLKENIILNDSRITYQLLFKKIKVPVHTSSAGIHQRHILEEKTVPFLALYKQKDLTIRDHQRSFYQKITNSSNNFFD